MILNDKTTNDIIWDGPNIPCISLCTGDTISTVIYNIAKKVCELTVDLDPAEISYSCIIDKSKTYGNIDLFLLFSILLKNDCDIYTLLQEKIDELDTSELLVDNLDLNCFLQSYLDANCTIIRFYNSIGDEINPNTPTTIFGNSEIKTSNIYYISDINQSIWVWDEITKEYKDVTSFTNLNTLCICELDQLNLDIKIALQVIIDNLCKLKSSGIVNACDVNFKSVPFNTVNPNTNNTVFIGDDKIQSSYYFSEITHKVWRWVEDENSYLPSIINNEVNIEDLDGCLLNLEVSFQNWIDLYNVYQEPLITSCLTENPEIVSVHIPLTTDVNICDLNSRVGTKLDIFKIVNNYCDNKCYFDGVVNLSMVFNDPACSFPNLSTYYISNNDKFVYKWNGAFYEEYVPTITEIEILQWNKVCSILNRVKSVETTCCVPSCDSNTIGFSSTYNVENNIFLLTFDKASGTNIDDSFTDCGSVLTAIDYLGNKVTMDIELSQDVEIEVDMNTLNISKPVSISIKSCLSNGLLQCKNCNSDVLPAINMCGICKLCVNAVDEVTSQDFVEIFYTLASNPGFVIQQKVYPGQCLTFEVPDDFPNIKSIRYTSNSLELVNSSEDPCMDINGNEITIPAPIADSCWYFDVPIPTNTHDIYFKNTTGVPLGIGPLAYADPFKAKFELHGNDAMVEDFLFYSDYIHNNTPLSGKIAQVMGNYDPLNAVIPKLPTGLPVLSSNICGGNYLEKIGTYPGGIINGPGVVIFDPDPLIVFPQIILHYEQTVMPNFGFIIKVAGQPLGITGIQQPEIAIKNPINNAITYIKGQLLDDDCGCPS